MYREIIAIRKHLKKKLSPSRFEHTLGVSYTCMALAMRYGADLDQAELAGLLHDCAKRYDDETILQKCEERGLPLTEGEYRAPAIVHAKLGAWMAEHKYGVTDAQVLSAIACHTTGKPGMTLLEKIVYIADYIEPRRDRAPHLTELRRLAFEDLDEALYRILTQTLSYLKEQDQPTDETTEKTWAYYRDRREERANAEPERNPDPKEEPRDFETRTGVREDSQNKQNKQEPKEEYSLYDRSKRYGKGRRAGAGRQKRRRYPGH